MQQRIFISLLFASLSLQLSSRAEAGNSSCPKLAIPEHITTVEPIACICGDELKAKNTESPYSGFKLVGQCNGGNQYFFKGSATYSGKLIFENNPDYDSPIQFIAPASSARPPFYYDHIIFDLAEYISPETVAKKFRISKKLIDQGKCVETNAVIAVNKMYVSIGDSDFDGSFATEYKIMKSGTFYPCKNGT